MKRTKSNKYLCFVFIFVFLTALLIPINAFASQNDTGMKVIAHIEAPSDRDSSPANTNTDSKSPQTGNNSNLNILIPILFICCSALAIKNVYKKRKDIQKNNA